ncbi:hypothetical protein BS78_09G094600 [Paspalum vaginatum]|nr:hypothetical protein BS78_09G094600 [Paspalum vaginatum]
MNPSSILVWNARGLNQRDQRISVRDTILSSRSDVVCIQETKADFMSQTLFLSVFGTDYDKFAALPAVNTRGGIVIAWKSSVCDVIASRIDNLSVFVQFIGMEGRNWWFTRVYATG